MTNIRRYIYALVISVATLLVGCIKNDLPHPVVELLITSLTAEGLIGDAVIDESNRKVTLTLQEQTDIQNVVITDVAYTENATPSIDLVGTHDMRSALHVTLSLYQDYAWEIEAVQNIERSFTVEGQIGSTEWNVASRTATAYVGIEDRSNIKVTSLKLAAADIATYQWSEGIEPHNFNTVRYVYVTCHGRTERWSLYVKTTDVVVDLKRADAWGKVLWLYGEGLSGTTLGFRYRKAGDNDWIEVDNVTTDGGMFEARVGGLTPHTEYEVVAYSDENTSATKRVTTEGILPLENGDFEKWETIRKIVCPYYTEEDAFWGTGNPGAAMVNTTVTDKSDDVRPGSSGVYSARLESKFANLAGIGKFAAGNLFIGKYVSTVGTNGVVSFGHPFAARPTALKLWVKYNCGAIDRIGTLPAGSTLQVGDPDVGSIFIALGTWSAEEYGLDATGAMQGTAKSPVIVDTRDKGTFFNPSSAGVVAYSELLLDHSVEQWAEYTIELDYNTTSVVPTHIIIVCSSSRYGDYFTGSTQSVMWLDDFELVYE